MRIIRFTYKILGFYSVIMAKLAIILMLKTRVSVYYEREGKKSELLCLINFIKNKRFEVERA